MARRLALLEPGGAARARRHGFAGAAAAQPSGPARPQSQLRRARRGVRWRRRRALDPLRAHLALRLAAGAPLRGLRLQPRDHSGSERSAGRDHRQGEHARDARRPHRLLSHASSPAIGRRGRVDAARRSLRHRRGLGRPRSGLAPSGFLRRRQRRHARLSLRLRRFGCGDLDRGRGAALPAEARPEGASQIRPAERHGRRVSRAAWRWASRSHAPCGSWPRSAAARSRTGTDSR